MAKKKRSYKRKTAKMKVDLVEKTIADEPFIDHLADKINQTVAEPVLQTTEAQPENRMLRYKRNPRCLKCDAHPVICMIRRPEYKKFRCRECGHAWEVFD